MKKFLVKTLIFSSVIMILFVCAEIIIRRVPNDYTFKREIILQRGESIETLILGSSHSYFAINPEYMAESVFSLAYTSQRLLYDKLIFERFLDDMPNIKNIVIPISYFSLSTKPNTGELMWRKYDYLMHYDIGDESITKLDINRYLITPNKGVRKTFSSVLNYTLLNKNNVTCNNFGANTTNNKNRTIDYLKEDALVASERHENNSLDFTRNLQYVEQVIEQSQTKGIQVFLITTPYTDFYTNKLNPTKIEKIKNTMTEVEITHNNVKYFNYASDSRFNYNDFNDSDYLNIYGQEKFSKILWQDIMKFKSSKSKL